MSDGLFDVTVSALDGTATTVDGIAADATSAGTTGSSGATTAAGAAGDGPLTGALNGFARSITDEATALSTAIEAAAACLRTCASNYLTTDDGAFQAN